jgi:hypothetical protein
MESCTYFTNQTILRMNYLTAPDDHRVETPMDPTKSILPFNLKIIDTTAGNTTHPLETSTGPLKDPLRSTLGPLNRSHCGNSLTRIHLDLSNEPS